MQPPEARASSPIAGHAAGVPFVAVPPPSGARSDAPVVAAWHLLDAPRTEAAFAAALPLAGLDAWRFYFGLPMTGSRLPAGGVDEIMRLAADDVLMNLYAPLVDTAAGEFGAAFADLRDRFGLGVGPLGLLGGSIGAAVAQQVLVGSGLPIRAAVLVSPVIQMRRAVELVERDFGITYTWSPTSTAVADRFDFVARARDPGEAAILAIVGEEDDAAFREPAAELVAALGDARARLMTVPGMGHALAEEPGLEPAPQTPHAAIVDREAAAWFRQHLT